MIIGVYPCCEELLCLEVGDAPTPRYNVDDCPHCGARVWHRISRIDPESWTEEDFLKEYEVDYKNFRIKSRKEEPVQIKVQAELGSEFKDAMDYCNQQILKAFGWPPAPEWQMWSLSAYQQMAMDNTQARNRTLVDTMIIDEPERVRVAMDFASKSPFDVQSLLAMDTRIPKGPLLATAPLTPPEPWRPPVARRNRRKRR